MIDGPTIGEAFRDATRRLASAGVPSAQTDARLLLGLALGVGPETIVAYPERRLSPSAQRELAKIIARRARREPLSHITGVREFWGLEFGVTEDTLDPRPASETLVETALGWVKNREDRLRILDLGTGTGCLLLALSSESTNAWGLGVDASDAAVAMARANARRLGLAQRATFQTGHWGEGIEGRFDIIVANPPYVRSDDIPTLAPEVVRFEPRLALDGGPDGLGSYRALAADVLRLLAPDGAAVVEFGFGQSEEVAAIMTAAGLRLVDFVNDLAGLSRCALLTAGPASRDFKKREVGN